MFSAILEGLEFCNRTDQMLFTPVHLRRLLIAHFLNNTELLKDVVIQGIMENYGWKDPEGNGDVEPGPFSVKSYFVFMAQDKEWGDSIMLTLAASLWSIRITVVSSRSLSETKFRHEDNLDMVDVALIYNNNEEDGHYSECIRGNKMVVATKKLSYSRNWDKAREVKERYGIGCPTAIQVARHYKIEISLLEKQNFDRLKSACIAFTSIESIVNDAPTGKKEEREGCPAVVKVRWCTRKKISRK